MRVLTRSSFFGKEKKDEEQAKSKEGGYPSASSSEAFLWASGLFVFRILEFRVCLVQCELV